MFTLRVFGGLSLSADTGVLPATATQRRRLALLTLLDAAGGRGLTRDRVAVLLWPESSSDSARHALDQLIYTTRRDLGADSVTTAGGALRLNADVVRSDRRAFEAAVASGDFARAATLYGGPFLDGVHLAGADEFDRWASAERIALEQQFARTLDSAATAAEARGDHAAVVAYRQRRAALDPLSAPATCALMRALAATGDRAAAIRQAGVFQALVREELGVPGDASVQALADQLRHEVPRSTSAVPIAPGEGVAAPLRPAEERPHQLRAERVTRTRRATTRQRGVVLPAAAALVVGALTLAMISVRSSHGAAQPGTGKGAAPSPAVVAVLPMAGAGNRPEDEYFSDGLTDELIYALSQVPGLRVVARTSTFSLKGTRADAREIGRKLGVRSLIEGSVRRSGDRVLVTVQLVDAENGLERWSERYDRSMQDMLTIQSEIATAVARHLSPAYSAASVNTSAVESPRDPRAYQLYLRGRYVWNHDGPGELRVAEQLLRQSLAIDSSYARTHAALADVYIDMAEASGAEPEQEHLLEVAEGFARGALARDPRLADASTAVGRLLMNKWDWSGADQQFRRAIEANPSFVPAHERLATLRALQRRFDEAAAEIRQAESLDPLSLGAQSTAAYIFTLARRYRDAEPEARNLIALDSMREDPHFRLGSVLVATGRTAEAEREFESAMRVSPEAGLRAMPMLGYTYALAGRTSDARKLRPRIEQGLGDHSVSPYFAMAYFGAIGDKARAFQVLDSLAARRESCLRDAAVDPVMDQLHTDPRFARALATIRIH